MDTKDIAKELGKRGGKKTLKKYGTNHYREMAKKRWQGKKKNNKTDT